jgi:GntR family transcriptional repressor for pyruvate dehydrogenase complex
VTDVVFQPAPTARQHTVADIVQHIVQQTVANRMEPGDRFPPERQLVEQLGVGRTVLRDAMKCLNVLGFVEVRQGDGTYLAEAGATLLSRTVSWGLLLGGRQAWELVEARHFVEVALARLAAQRRTEDDIAAIDRCLDRMATPDSADEFAKAEGEFHAAIAAASHNAPLQSVFHAVMNLLDGRIQHVIRRAEDVHIVVDQYRAIADAIEAGDERMASAKMAGHIAYVTALLGESLAERAEAAPVS